MGTTNINFRVDDELKKQAEELFDYLGLTMSGALTMFLKTSVNNNGIPFELKRGRNEKVLADAMREADLIAEHPNMYKRYSSAAEMLEDILNEA